MDGFKDTNAGKEGDKVNVIILILFPENPVLEQKIGYLECCENVLKNWDLILNRKLPGNFSTLLH
jgi:hypothetical protein